MNTSRICSIGWLHGENGTFVLTPCIDGNQWPHRISVSAEEFETLGGSKERMIEYANQKLFPKH